MRRSKSSAKVGEVSLGGRARVRELSFSSNTRRGVSVTTNREPPEEGFKEDKKDKR